MDIHERGEKHICSKCGTKFYDLKKDILICPRCGEKKSNDKLYNKGNIAKSNNLQNGEKDSDDISEEDLDFEDSSDESQSIVDID